MTQTEIARRMRFTLSQEGREPSTAFLVGFGWVLVGAAYFGWQFGCWLYLRIHGGM